MNCDKIFEEGRKRGKQLHTDGVKPNNLSTQFRDRRTSEDPSKFFRENNISSPENLSVTEIIDNLEKLAVELNTRLLVVDKDWEVQLYFDESEEPLGFDYICINPSGTMVLLQV